MAELHGAPSKQADEDNFWVTASTGSEFAAVTPMAWSFNDSSAGKWASYVYTDRPVYRPGHTVHWKALLRARVENHLELPKIPSIHVRIADEQDHAIFDKQMPVSAKAPSPATSRSPTPPRSATTPSASAIPDAEDLRQLPRGGIPQARVPGPCQRAEVRVLQGADQPITIDSRYFFGEPVANAAR